MSTGAPCRCGHSLEKHLGYVGQRQDPCAGGTPGFCGCQGYTPAPSPAADHQQQAGRAVSGDQPEQIIVLSERTRFGEETGAGLMRNRCAFTSRDMGDDWPAAFTYAVVMGWDGDDDEDGAMDAMAARWGWDEAMVEFVRDAHRRFEALTDRAATTEDGAA